MPTNSITNIRTGIKTVLDTVDSLEAVYTYEPLQLPKLPCATIYFDGHDPERTEVASITVTYKFFVALYIDLIDAEDCEEKLETVVWDVMSALADNINLSGTCDYSEDAGGKRVDFVNRQRPIRGYLLEIHAIKEED